MTTSDVCKVFSRDEFMYSRKDTTITQDNLGGVLVKYDSLC